MLKIKIDPAVGRANVFLFARQISEEECRATIKPLPDLPGLLNGSVARAWVREIRLSPIAPYGLHLTR
ncbi:MAG: hypothetical protein HOP34_01980 [Methylococcaceae bacterium]|nr:hypothetical protein [Methylococcaceae bacterium]